MLKGQIPVTRFGVVEDLVLAYGTPTPLCDLYWESVQLCLADITDQDNLADEFM